MIQKISYTLVACLLVFNMNALAQEEKEADINPYDHKHAVGGNLGETTGLGLAYRHSFDRFSAQISFWPVVEDFETNVNLQTSLSFYYRLREYEHVNLLLYQGNEYQYRKQLWYYPNEPFYSGEQRINGEHLYSTSLGVGIEFLMGERVSLNLMLGYAAMDNFKSFKLKGESGLFFHF